MAIPPRQLETWTNQGATVGSKTAHESVRTALARHAWPESMAYSPYLQGSYANSTNIRGDSDVDLVVETTSLCFANIASEDLRDRGFPPAPHTWAEFRQEVLNALTNYYGTGVTVESKCIRVPGTSGRLAVDVLAAAGYHRYDQGRLQAEGVTFWENQGLGQQIVNYPKLHKEYGAEKNARTSSQFKPTVRMFKNARGALPSTMPEPSRRFASYFVECLLSNAPNRAFSSDRADTMLEILRWLERTRDEETWGDLATQSRQHPLIGQSSVQWSEQDFPAYVDGMITLWNEWS